MSVLAGVFVGGKSTRMGGRAKGLLQPPSGEASIVERWITLARSLGVPYVLVGRRAEYESFGEVIDDDPPEIGPIGGLHALVKHAKVGIVLALACDMPFPDERLVRRLLQASMHPIVAPRREARWEPLFARYDVETMIRILPERIARGEHRLQGLLDEHGVALETSPEENAMLADWDEPGDVR